MSEAPTAIYVQWSDDGQHIRKWSHEPFDGSAAFVDAGELAALRAEMERMREALAFIGHLATCDHGHAHYCPNCDRSLSEIGDTVQTALTQTKDTTDDA